MAIIALEGMRFFAHHGVFAQERIDGNDFEVDVWVDGGPAALPLSDRIEEAMDYGRIYAITAEVMAEPRNLLETLVATIGKRLFDEFPQARSVRVRVAKENPPVSGAVRRSVVEETFFP